jgi:hypothetical protein
VGKSGSDDAAEAMEGHDDDEKVEHHPDEETPEITPLSYTDDLKDHEHVLVQFYKEEVHAEFSGARDLLEHGGFLGKKLGLAKMSATSYPDFVKQFNLGELPAMKWFHKGTVVDYEGPTDHESVANQALTKSG